MTPDAPSSNGETTGDQAAAARRLVQAKKFDAALVFPPDFASRLEAYRKAIQDDAAAGRPSETETPRRGDAGTKEPPRPRVPASPRPFLVEIPRPEIIYTTANERSAMAWNRLTAVLDRWTEEIGKVNLVAGGMPARAVRPVRGRQFQPGRRSGKQVGQRLVSNTARDALAVGDDRRFLSGGRLSPARRNAARWKPCSAALPNGAKSCSANC